MTGEAPAFRYRVSVRELCAFTAMTGDLDLRHTPAPTAAEGIRGHARVAASRGSGYVRERPLVARHGLLEVRGRADGYWPDRAEIEEIKTHRGAVERIADHHRALHRAQLQLYGAMLCQELDLPEVRLTLVYFDVVRERETRITEVHAAAYLRERFEDHARRFLDWAVQQRAHALRRDAALQAMSFPHARMYPGQRRLAEAVFRACRDRATLLAQAPTGTGKTLGTLFPALKAMGQGRLDRVFYLTARTPGRRLALEALERLSPTPDRPLRVLELVARDKACEHPDKACHGESCPLARGFFDRLPAARQAAQSMSRWDHAAVRELARVHRVCPYYLAQELARWSDVVVGDVNYYFDLSALLAVLTQANDWRVALLIDEAHNLLERGRAMYGAKLDPDRLALARLRAPPALKRPLQALQRAWAACHATQTAAYQVHASPPPALHEALGTFTAAVTERLSDAPGSLAPEVMSLHFDALQWRALAESFDAHSLFDVSLRPYPRAGGRSRAVLCIRNVVPAPFLAERLRTAASATLFSATLRPASFYRAMLGLPGDTRELEVESPFDPGQLEVRLAPRISTRYADRAASVAPIADLIAERYDARSGNYLAFFSSFDYLEAVAAALAGTHPQVPAWQQRRGMNEADRQAFLDRFVDNGRGVGLAVLGGAFAEGVDLRGSRLIGVFVATLGLPQFNPVNEEFRRRLDTLFGDRHGHDYTYLYPGLQKVVQAAGRVIRSRTDRGSIVLIDDRYAQARVRALLPGWWPPPRT